MNYLYAASKRASLIHSIYYTILNKEKHMYKSHKDQPMQYYLDSIYPFTYHTDKSEIYCELG